MINKVMMFACMILLCLSATHSSCVSGFPSIFRGGNQQITIDDIAAYSVATLW